MAKKTVTYTDLEGGAPVITFHGKSFTSTVPVQVDEDADAALLEAAESNRFFEVGGGSAPKPDSTLVAKGRKAAQEGKPRSVPPSYRGEEKKAEAEAWLYGYDEGTRQGAQVMDMGSDGLASADDHEALANASSGNSGRVSGVSTTYPHPDDTQDKAGGKYPDDAFKSE